MTATGAVIPFMTNVSVRSVRTVSPSAAMRWMSKTSDSDMSRKPWIDASDASLPTAGAMPTLWYTTSSASSDSMVATSLAANAVQNSWTTWVGVLMERGAYPGAHGHEQGRPHPDLGRRSHRGAGRHV